MQRITLGGLVALLVLPVAIAQNPPAPPAPGYPGAGPAYAFDITKADIDNILKNTPGIDRQIRVVDMGKYNLGVGIIQKGATSFKPGEPVPIIYHDYTAETYIVISGEGILATGGEIENKKPMTGVPPIINGPGGRGFVGTGAYIRRVQTGDVVIIPPGVAHGWTFVADHVTYLSVRPDPDRVLPGGYVNPALLKNPPAEANRDSK